MKLNMKYWRGGGGGGESRDHDFSEVIEDINSEHVSNTEQSGSSSGEDNTFIDNNLDCSSDSCHSSDDELPLSMHVPFYLGK